MTADVGSIAQNSAIYRRASAATGAPSLQKLKLVFEDRAYCSLTRRFRPDDAAYMQDIANAAARAQVATVATGDVLYRVPEMRMLQDFVTCVRLKTTRLNAQVS